MADEKDKDIVVADANTAKTSQALADAGALAEEQSIDEGEEGGHYIVGGVHVNAYSKPIKQDSKGKWVLVNPDDRKDMG